MESVKMAIARASREKGASSFLRDRSDRSSANIFSIVRAWINGSVGIGCSRILGIECGGDCSNLKVCVIVSSCLRCSFRFFDMISRVMHFNNIICRLYNFVYLIFDAFKTSFTY